MKKLFISCLLLSSINAIITAKNDEPVLKNHLLKLADKAGKFHDGLPYILQTRLEIIKLLEGKKEWSGAAIDLKVESSNEIVTVYCRRAEIIEGATFVVISPDHELASTISAHNHLHGVKTFIDKICQHSLYERQMTADNHAVFTGSYAINPFNNQKLPIYISDYAIECFDIRHSKARLGVPAHNSKDFEFAQHHTLPIKIVVDVKNDTSKHPIAAPLVDTKGNLTTAYLGEYKKCIVTSKNLYGLSLPAAAQKVIDYLESHACGHAYTEPLQYTYDNNVYPIKNLAKIEAIVYQNDNQTSVESKKDLKLALNYAQADFLEIVEQFFINIENTKALLAVLIDESCQIRGNMDCYLLQWSQINSNEDPKNIFHRDVTSMRQLLTFCKDLILFLDDLAHSCPLALENIRKQNS